MNNLKLISLVLGSSLVTGSLGLLIGAGVQSKNDVAFEKELMDGYHNQIEEIEERMDNKKKELENERDYLEERIEKLKNITERKDSVISELQDSISKLNSEIEAQKSVIDALMNK